MESYETKQISRVQRPKQVAKVSYDRMSRWYDLLAGSSEWRYVQTGLELLDALEGERILEIGHGTGKAIVALAQAVGPSGLVQGIDLSEGMHTIASERLRKAGVSERVELHVGDAATLSYEANSFDAVFSSFTLELFDTPEIPVVLKGCQRALRSEGRIVVVSMAKKSEETLAVKLYDWAHERMPSYFDCRPIYVAESITEAGFQVVKSLTLKMWGLPVDIVLGQKT